MDPLSIIASSIAVAHAVNVTLRKVQATRRAKPELDTLHNEISDLCVVLRELQGLLQLGVEGHNRYPPSARLTQAVNSTKQKLEQLASQVIIWGSDISADHGTLEQKRFRIFRVGSKATKFREEFRRIREDLTSLFGALTA